MGAALLFFFLSNELVTQRYASKGLSAPRASGFAMTAVGTAQNPAGLDPRLPVQAGWEAALQPERCSLSFSFQHLEQG